MRPLSETSLTFRADAGPAQHPMSWPPRPVSEAKRQRIAALVKECLEKDLIEPSDSEWASAVVLVPQPGRKDRLCIVYRPLGEAASVPAYPQGLASSRHLTDFKGNCSFLCSTSPAPTGK